MRRTEREFLRPEDLLPVAIAARMLGVSRSCLHNDINAGKLRCHLFGTARRVKPEDLEAYARARAAYRPPVGENWLTVRAVVLAAGINRTMAYRLIKRGVLPARAFGGSYYIRSEDMDAFLRRGEPQRP